MKLIVGLGNPGIKYKGTRHNVGFMFVDSIASYLKCSFKLVSKLKSQIAIIKTEDGDVCLCKPMTYMNLSGEAVKSVMQYYNISIDDILIVHDDLDLPVGRIRMREKGSHGGHNGMRNIIDLLGTNNIKRIRIGIDKKENVIDYVLGKFNKEEQEKIDKVLIIAPNIYDDFQKLTFPNLMNRYNQNE